MKNKHYQFKFVEEWKIEKQFTSGENTPFVDRERNFPEIVSDYGKEGYRIVAVNYVMKDKKLYMAITMQKEIG